MIDETTANLVRDRANFYCEYCRMHQSHDPFFHFHIEHVIPRQHGGEDHLQNLAFACPHCNAHKGPNLAGIDPSSGAIVPLFNPRRDRWNEHFEIRGIYVVGRTPTGRATVQVLAMNAAGQLDVRAQLRADGQW